MIDLHTHTSFSDGALIPAELARRARSRGYGSIVCTDHSDYSNIFWILENQVTAIRRMSPYCGLDLFVGVELTHVPPPLIPDLARTARMNGAQLVVVHGETLVEPVERGTNLAAIEAGVDVLAHPGLIGEEEVRLAAGNGVMLEISTRKGHCLANGHVAAMARRFGAGLVVNNDAHAPEDLVSEELRQAIALGAGLSAEEYAAAENNSRAVIQRMLQRTDPA
jgi:histidinol phosphatase-like PHP family hydrolase